MKILIIRPQPGADASAKRVQAAGFEPVVMPLFAIEALPWEVPDAAAYDALLLTSGNAVRQAGEAVRNLPLPVLAVGEATARAARQAGLDVALTGIGGAADLLREAETAGYRRLLWLAGEDRTETEIPDGLTVDTTTVYRSAALPAPTHFAQILDKIDFIMLHSPRAARHLRQLCPEKSGINLAALSLNIAEAAGDGWRAILVSPTPDDATLLSHLQSRFTTGPCDP